MNPRIRWSQPPASWDAPGWAPLVDHGPLPLQTARTVGRWLWPTLSVSGFLAVTGFVFATTTPPPACRCGACAPSPWPPPWSSCSPSAAPPAPAP